MIDGAEWGPLGMVEQKSYETAKYYTLTKHFNMPGSVAVNSEWFNGLPPDYQNAMMEAADEARVWFDETFDADEAGALAKLYDLGMEINENPDIDPFREAVRPVYDKYAEDVGGWDLINEVIATQ